ncbi:MAG: glycine cleavage system aminomethyltransferase GcvT [Candidatus Binataceae bacterium]
MALVKLGVVNDSVKHTPLYATHRRLGARMTEFGGFAMPVQYAGIIAEHRAVRAAAGLFDLSHMGEFELRGAGAVAMLERAFSNSAARLVDGQAQYTIMCADDGGTIDDLIVYRRASNHYLLCVNASNIAADWAQLAGLAHPDVELEDVSDATALIAVQGPQAAAILAPLTRIELGRLGRFRIADGEVAGVKCLVARTGYTGEDGFELFTGAAHASRLFEAILAAGAPAGLQPCGLGARDTLRMEAGLPLYGHELDRQTSPLEAGLGAFVRFGHGFVGETALADQRSRRLGKHLIGIRTDDGKSIARQGYPLFRGETRVGVVTSGTFAPSFARPLAMAYVDTAAGIEATQPYTHLAVEIRSRKAEVTVMPLPFYKRDKR